MLALELDGTQVKHFMGRLLRETDFDGYVLRSAEVASASHYSVEGEQTWAEIRPFVYEIIKIGGKPKSLKLVLAHATPDEIHPNAKALFLNLLYEADSVTFTTATAQREFALDKSLDAAWDDKVRGFFAELGIPVRDRQ
jgi:hypothetical protein